MDDTKPVRVRLTGLWKNETKSGVTYFSGSLGYKVKLEIWPNQKRPGTKDPDYQVYVVPEVDKPKADVDAQYFPTQQAEPEAVKVLSNNIQDVPF